MFLFAGCMTNVPMDITQSKRPSAIPLGYSVNVRPSIKLATLEDTMAMMGSTFRVHSGKIFAQVFKGDESAAASVDLVNSHITQSDSDYMVLWSTVQVTYTATIVLRRGDQVHTLNSTGIAHTKWDVTDAAKEAVERVTLDLARQCEAILRTK